MPLGEMRFWLHFKTFEFFMQKTTDSLTNTFKERSRQIFLRVTVQSLTTQREILRFSRAVSIVGRPTRLDAAAVYNKEVSRTLATVLRYISM